MIWFSECESIISAYLNGEKLPDFQKRVWTALYWFGETMTERETSSLIIKFATCLEALFNSREGGISEQISEFTAFVCGKSPEERIYIYDNVKKLYKLRCIAVHGGTLELDIEDQFLSNVRRICERSVIEMIHRSCQERWSKTEGYQDFVRHILRNFSFSGG